MASRYAHWTNIVSSHSIDKWNRFTHLRFHTMIEICCHLWITCCFLPELPIEYSLRFGLVNPQGPSQHFELHLTSILRISNLVVLRHCPLSRHCVNASPSSQTNFVSSRFARRPRVERPLALLTHGFMVFSLKCKKVAWKVALFWGSKKGRFIGRPRTWVPCLAPDPLLGSRVRERAQCLGANTK